MDIYGSKISLLVFWAQSFCWLRLDLMVMLYKFKVLAATVQDGATYSSWIWEPIITGQGVEAWPP